MTNKQNLTAMENIENKINRYFGDQTETLIGSMLRWGFTNEELDEAENKNLIKYLGNDESVVYKL